MKKPATPPPGHPTPKTPPQGGKTGPPKGGKPFPKAVGLALSVAFLSASLIACGSFNSTAKKAILLANDGQAAASEAYTKASVDERVAARNCAGLTGITPSAITPETWPAIRDGCTKAGSPIPYDPFRLQRLAGPINGLYDGLRNANVIRVKWEAGMVTDDAIQGTLAQLAVLFTSVTIDLADAHVPIPTPVMDAATALKAAGGAK